MTDFDCVCDYDAPTFYRSSMRKSRKLRGCYECAGNIRPGETYEHHFGIQDGMTYSGATCAHCVAIRDWVTGNIPCFCWAHGNMIPDAHDTIEAARERAPDETVGLRFGLLRRIEIRDRFNSTRSTK